MADGGGGRARVSRQWWSLWWPLCTHLPSPSFVTRSLKLPWNTLCVLSFIVFVCVCFVCILRILRILLSCVFSHCLLLLSAHLLRTINENAHINISYFNTKPTHSNDSNNKSLAASCATASPTLPRHAHSRHFYFSLLEIFPPIKLTYAHSASHSFPTLLHPPLSPTPSSSFCFTFPLTFLSFFMAFFPCVCLHKFCNISGLCLQLANALKTQIYIFLCSQAVELFSVVTLSHCPTTPPSPYSCCPLQSIRIIEFEFVDTDDSFEAAYCFKCPLSISRMCVNCW